MSDMDYTGMDSDRMFGAGESVTLLDQIKADRDAGTPGPWSLKEAEVSESPFNWWIYCEGWGALGYRTGHKDRHGGVESWGHMQEDARRIARVPDMEAALLAAGELADEAERMESELGCDDIGCMCETVRAALASFRSAIEVK